MRAVRAVLNFLAKGGVRYIFGIPAGSVNAFFDELYEMDYITPIVTKHEGAASYMAAAYARYSRSLGVCIGSSGPGSTNLISGAANAMREHLPILFLTGAVPVKTIGLNASQELDAQPIYQSITKYSVTVKRAEDLLSEVVKATKIALSGVPGPVHVAMPLDVQSNLLSAPPLPEFPSRSPMEPDPAVIKRVVNELNDQEKGFIFIGQGARNCLKSVIEVAELLDWPVITTPQAKGFIPESHPLRQGIFGFAGDESASEIIEDDSRKILLIIGSSLGETATNNWNPKLTENRLVVQMDFDESVFNREYQVDIPVLGDIDIALPLMIEGLKVHGWKRENVDGKEKCGLDFRFHPEMEYNTQNVLLALQQALPPSTRYTVDIGEMMSYVIHYMNVFESNTFDINVHFGAMGSAIGAAIGSKLADPTRPVTCITGDGCFFMHGMELLTAKEYDLPILFVVINNARLGMVYHGHSLQFKRSHPHFEQEPVNIKEMARSMGIRAARIERMEDISKEMIGYLLEGDGPSILDVSLVDNQVPPMGERVKFLSSFSK